VERTSLRVGRRNPLDVGLRSGREPVPRFAAVQITWCPGRLSDGFERLELTRALLTKLALVPRASCRAELACGLVRRGPAGAVG
jgi:hypothetical protein